MLKSLSGAILIIKTIKLQYPLIYDMELRHGYVMSGKQRGEMAIIILMIYAYIYCEILYTEIFIEAQGGATKY